MGNAEQRAHMALTVLKFPYIRLLSCPLKHSLLFCITHESSYFQVLIFCRRRSCEEKLIKFPLRFTWQIELLVDQVVLKFQGLGPSFLGCDDILFFHESPVATQIHLRPQRALRRPLPSREHAAQ